MTGAQIEQIVGEVAACDAEALAVPPGVARGTDAAGPAEEWWFQALLMMRQEKKQGGEDDAREEDEHVRCRGEYAHVGVAEARERRRGVLCARGEGLPAERHDHRMLATKVPHRRFAHGVLAGVGVCRSEVPRTRIEKPSGSGAGAERRLGELAFFVALLEVRQRPEGADRPVGPVGRRVKDKQRLCRVPSLLRVSTGAD